MSKQIGQCPKRVVLRQLDTVDLPSFGEAQIFLEWQRGHDWRESLVPGIYVCGACGALRHMERQQPAAAGVVTPGEGE